MRRTRYKTRPSWMRKYYRGRSRYGAVPRELLERAISQGIVRPDDDESWIERLIESGQCGAALDAMANSGGDQMRRHLHHFKNRCLR